MQRVLVIGPCGAGKSTLAGEIGSRLGLPVIHIDQLNWQPGWVESDKAELSARIVAATAGDNWVIDGNYGGTMAERLTRADTVVYLDFPVRICFWRILRRWWMHRGKSRPDMTEGCPERLDTAFLWYVLRWNSGPGPRTEARLRDYQGKLIRLHGPNAVAKWLEAL
jgi:adenylate kinase family enzyme